jgi:uncharacterized protein (DUF2141 family)
MISHPDGIQKFRYWTLRSGLKLEIAGMKRSRGRSCYTIVKDEFGFKGSRQKVLEQLIEYLEGENK